MNWVAKWFKPSGAWTPAQLTVALGQIFERALSSSPAAVLPREVGEIAAAGWPGSDKRASAGKRVLTFAAPARSGSNKKTRAGARS
jgi:hypothetical protein